MTLDEVILKINNFYKNNPGCKDYEVIINGCYYDAPVDVVIDQIEIKINHKEKYIEIR